jgi:hypothetical protein
MSPVYRRALLIGALLSAGCSEEGTGLQTPAGHDAGAGDAEPPDAEPHDADARDADLRDGDLTDAGAACPAEAPAQFEECTREMVGQLCVYAMVRCRCETGSGFRWNCEPNECPEDPQAGQPCTPGLRCGTGFEDHGYTCVSPENVWAYCPFNHFLGPDTRNPAACPDPRPEEGTPCCQAQYPLGAPKDCPYEAPAGTERDECINEHWDRAAR